VSTLDAAEKQAMGDLSSGPAARILIIDDTPAIHQDFRRILTSSEGSARLDVMEAQLFGTRSSSRPKGFRFEVDSAYQGEEGLRRMRAARAEGRPYALAFVDVRMPPGMDGVETTARLWEEEPDLQVVLCSAYADYSWEQVTQRLGISQRLLILRKPFDSIEVRQLAHALVEKWQLLHRDRARMEELARAVKERTRELELSNLRLRREVEERLQLESQLAEARRLDALGRLAAGLAHEVNNPLSFVISNIHYIGRELELRPDVRDSVRDMDELREACNDALLGCERIRRLVHDVRLFARMGGGPTSCLVDVRAALEEALAISSTSLPPSVQLTLELRPVPPVMADPHGLSQVFLNLLVNAAQALEGTAPPRIRVATGVHPDGRVLVEIQDNGQGILPEHLDRIFEPFFTTKPVGVGTGLGLSICHGIISSLGGELSVESQPGQGATFRVLLPVASPRPDAEP
jgi:signal transduction histidine kinase